MNPPYFCRNVTCTPHSTTLCDRKFFNCIFVNRQKNNYHVWLLFYNSGIILPTCFASFSNNLQGVNINLKYKTKYSGLDMCYSVNFFI
jgi:hypothetical protein